MYAGGFVYLRDGMETIGQTLREAREKLGLTVEEVERSIHIRKLRLEALENDDFDSLPSRVQALGFLRNYAEFLGLELNPILERFSDVEGKQRDKGRRPAKRQNLEEGGIVGSPRRIRIGGDQVITGIVGVAVIALLAWGATRIFAGLNPSSESVTDSTASSQPAPSETPTLTPQLVGLANPTSTASEPTLTPTLLLGLVDAIELELLAEQNAFVQVTVDGDVEFEGRVQSGERLSFRGIERVEISTGNARGLRVIFNGQDQGLMGDVNQVLTRVWTIRGMQTPTPTQTLTPTITPPVSATPTATATNVQGG